MIVSIVSVQEAEPALVGADIQRVDNVLVVLATQDGEYSPIFNIVAVYLKAIANLVESSFKADSLHYLPQ